ncbi:MAG: wax ester/triacylglycerol synthase family O-acyltransferase, partial [Acidimicrobiia bacterium]|nr:wax ester/triacylglycerol synthase family O-acyltransferase [Acidimicrobiia bacterium]
MKRLTGMDAGFLYMETPTMPMHVAGLYVYDPAEIPGGFSMDTVRTLVESRLHLLPPYRQRVVEIPFQLYHPLWIEDPDFDLDYHLRRSALPAPGGMAELAEFAADVMSRALDRSKPLWEMWVVEGLEGGLVGCVSKTHHAAIDGASGVDLTAALLDLEATVPTTPPPDTPWTPDRIPTDPELVGYALQSLSRQPVAAVKAVRRTVEAAMTLRRRNRQPDVTPPPAPFSAPRTSLNRAITPRRSFGMAEITLDDVKAVRKGLGGTVNDVVLAVCAGALREYFDDKDEHPDRPLVAMCPISIRSQDQRGAMGNQVSSMLVSLATDVDDPVERLRLIQAGTKESKEQAGAIGADTLTDWVEFAAPAVAARAARLYSRTQAASRMRPAFNVTISNVPGPQVPLYMGGSKLVAWYPMGPIGEGLGLNMTVMSYLGVVYFGLVACPESVPNVQSLANHVTDALEDLK